MEYTIFSTLHMMVKMLSLHTPQARIFSILPKRALYRRKFLTMKLKTFFASQKLKKNILFLRCFIKRKLEKIYYYLKKMPVSFHKNLIINLLFFIVFCLESKLFILKISLNLLKITGAIISKI